MPRVRAWQDRLRPALGTIAFCAATGILVGCGVLCYQAIFAPPLPAEKPAIPITDAEAAACRKQIDRLRPYALHATPSGEPPSGAPALYEQNAVTVAHSGLTRIPQPHNYTRAVSEWGSIRFIGQITLAAVNLNTRTANVQFEINSEVGMSHSFPHGTTLALAVATTTGGYVMTPLVRNIQFVGGFATVRATLPLAGRATSYPNDSYRLTFRSIFVLADLPSKPQLEYPVNLDPSAVSDNVFTASNVSEVPGRRLVMPDQQECDTTFALVFGRAGGAWFVWLIAALPFVFVLLVLRSYIDVCAERNASKKGTLTSPSTPVSSRARIKPVIETGAAFITIFTLHGVLVPNDISGVTRVDYLLGVEGALIVWLFVASSVSAFDAIKTLFAAARGFRLRSRDVGRRG